MAYKILFVFGLLSLIQARPLELKCPPRYEQINDKCYYFSDISENLQMAKIICRGQRGVIAEINNKFELNNLINASKFERFWCKISDDLADGGQSSLIGPFSSLFSSLKEDEKEKKYRIYSGLRNSNGLSDSMLPFICESNAVFDHDHGQEHSH